MKSSKDFTGAENKINRRDFMGKGLGLSAALALVAAAGLQAGEGPEKKLPAEDVAKELEKKVAEFMPVYRSCAITSFAVLNDYFELNADMKTIRALMPFSGGIVRQGETCGAVTGSMLALGLLFENQKKEGKVQTGASLKPGGMFVQKFEKEFGSTRCREVINHQFGRYYDLMNPEDVKLFMEAGKKGQCMQVVQKAVSMAGEIITKTG